jgi:hypothetical protein
MSNYERHHIYVTLKWKEPQGLSHTYEISHGLLSEERPTMFCCRLVWKGSFVKEDYDVDKHVKHKNDQVCNQEKVGQLKKNQEIMARKRRR